MNKTSLCLWAILSIGVSSCGNKTQGTGSTGDSTAVTMTVTADNDGKHTAEYIALRLSKIYELRNDSLCCSQHYLGLYAEASEKSQSEGTIFLDADHWTMGQDVSEDWSYGLQQVNNITDTTAKATMIIHNFTDQKVVLDLVFERDDWYVDNFYSYYEGADYDEAGNTIPGSEGIKEFDELKAITEYLNQEPVDAPVEADKMPDVPRRNTVRELERQEAAAAKAKEKAERKAVTDYAE